MKSAQMHTIKLSICIYITFSPVFRVWLLLCFFYNFLIMKLSHFNNTNCNVKLLIYSNSHCIYVGGGSTSWSSMFVPGLNPTSILLCFFLILKAHLIYMGRRVSRKGREKYVNFAYLAYKWLLVLTRKNNIQNVLSITIQKLKKHCLTVCCCWQK